MVLILLMFIIGGVHDKSAPTLIPAYGTIVIICTGWPGLLGFYPGWLWRLKLRSWRLRWILLWLRLLAPILRLGLLSPCLLWLRLLAPLLLGW